MIEDGLVPGTPIITGRNLTFQGKEGSLTCTSLGGNPAPTVKWFRKAALIDDILDTPKVPNVTRNTYNYTADISYHLAVFECRVDNTVLQSYLSATIFLEVYKEPNTPMLTASSPTVSSGTTNEWTCISTGGNPPPNITMRIGNSQLTWLSTVLQQSAVQQSDNTYTITSVLSWAPNVSFDGRILYCDVQHKDTRGLNDQTASLLLNVIARIPVVTVNQSTYSEITGQSVTLQCTVSSPESILKSVLWIFDNGVSSKILHNLLKVTIPEPSYSVLIGRGITIHCTVTGTPTQTNVTWRKVVNGVQTNVDINGNGRYSGGTIAAPSLTITNTQNTDEGTYVCYATNIVGTSNSQNTFLEVTGGVPNVTIVASSFEVQICNSITIECTVTAIPVVTSVYWTSNVTGQITNIRPSSNPSKYGGSTTLTPSLTIFNANFSDAGNYQCFANNYIGTGSSQEISLDVQGEIPTVQVNLPSYNVDYFSSKTLICSIVSKPAVIRVYWEKTLGGTTIEIDVINSGGKYSEKPTVTIQQRIYYVNYGITAVLVCTVNANPAHTIVYWQKIKDGITSDINVANSNNKYKGSTVSKPSLEIHNVDIKDEAYYVCYASNIVGTGGSTQTFLDVSGDIPVVIISSNIYSVLLGGTVTLQCTVSSNPAHTSVTWQRIVNGVLNTVTVDGSRIIGSSVSTPSLTISNAASGDEGNYICTATNIVGTGTSQQTFLDVAGDIPTVTVAQNQYSAIHRQTITMICTVQANPMETSVNWIKIANGNATIVNMINVRYSGSTVISPSLTIAALELSDQGHYQCSAENHVGTGYSQQTYLDVIGDVPFVQVLSTTYSVLFGGTIDLGCKVNANPSATNVYWQKLLNGVLITIDMSTNNFNKYSGSTVQSPSLTIISTTEADQGNYVCSATNSAGTGSSSQTFLNVVGNLPTVSIPRSTYSGNVSSQITIPCTVSAKPTETNIYWTVAVGNNAEQTISMTNTQKYQGSSVNSPSLIILNIPTVTVGQPIYLVNYGQSVQLVCSVTSTPTHTHVYWTRIQNGLPVTISLTNTARYSGSTVNNPSLTISNVDQNDETYYICYATNTVGTGHSQQTCVDVIGSPPEVYIQSNSYNVLLEQTVTLVCTISADPNATSVRWYKVINGVQSSLFITVGKYNTPTVSSPNLIVNTAAQSDEGYYVCTATNIVGTGTSSQTYLTVTGNLPLVTVTLLNYNTNIGVTVTLGCTVVASPSATNVYWERIVNNQQQSIDTTSSISRYSGSTVSNPSLVITNAQPSDEGNYICYATNSIGTGNSQQTYLNVIGINSPTLTISNATLNDEGYYVCVATNSVGNGQSSQCYLDVIGSIPTVIIGSDYYPVNYGNTATIECNVVATPTETSISWQKIQNTVPSTVVISGRYQGGNVSSPNLIITDVDNTDEAFYICYATNSVGTGKSSQTYLDVQGTVPSVQIISNFYSVEICLSVTLQCSVTANPSHSNVTWNKIVNGQQTNIGSNSRYSGGSINTPSLTISNVVDTDEGYYICTAVNAVGTSQSAQTYVDVTGIQNVYWQKNTNGVQTNISSTTNTTKYSGSTIGTPSLTILNSESNDIGSYICYATNCVGTGHSQQTHLSVVANVPSVTVGQGYTVVIGNSITMTCSILATPSASSVQWNRMINNALDAINVTSNLTKYSGATVSTPSLTIYNCDEGDEGYYNCQATNSVGTGTSTQTFLNVLGTIPVVTSAQSHYIVSFGSSVTMNCTVSANPVHTSVYWQKDVNGVATNINLFQTSKYSGSSITSPSLTIISAVFADEGYYTCNAQNSVGTGISLQIFLSVSGGLPVVTGLVNRYTVNVGNTITLRCSVNADPTAISVTWQRYINNVETDIEMSSGRYGGSSVGSPSLVISNTVMSDEGFYICTATNRVGSTKSQQIFLDVIGGIPIVTVPLTRYTVNIGSSVTIQCTYTANPAATSVIWEKTVANQGRFSGSTVSSPSLNISNAQLSDQGTYVCYAVNSVGTAQSTNAVLYVTGSIPIVRLTRTSFTGYYGDNITLGCTVSANPAVTSVFWQKVFGSLTFTVDMSNSRYTGSSVSKPFLNITNLNNNDAGNYVCLAANPVGIGQSIQGPLRVIGSVPVVTAGQTIYSTNIGNNITLICIVSAIPTLTAVYWTRQISNGNTVTLNPASSTKYSGSTIQSPSLTIINVELSEEGNYICHATNAVGTRQSSQTFLDVIVYIPNVTVSRVSSVEFGKSVTINCTVTSLPAATQITWQRNVNNVNTTIDIRMIKYSGGTTSNPSLTISRVQADDQGQYFCQASNIEGTGTSNYVNLTVIGDQPTSIAISPSKVSVNESQTITATCTAEGSPTITYTWFKGNTNTQLSTGSVLQITSSTWTDAGTYQCRASNTYGNVGANVTVNVSHIPHVTTQPPQGIVGESVTIQCIYVSNPVATNVIWKKRKPRHYYKCASLCGGKKERISPQPAPKRVEIPVYYEEPDESVISLRKLEIPTFKHDTKPSGSETRTKYVYRKRSDSEIRPKNSNRKPSGSETRTKNAYSRHYDHDDTSYDFEINQFLQSEDVRQ
ncbi:HMCN [Mytilus edulis]|uniref:HMCN n=1 Tax=Mytilus edulis TaxID=6550 RepID=A0A8S3QB40_MYTED|nr:HMCN [Mytilus edulis]